MCNLPNQSLIIVKGLGGGGKGGKEVQVGVSSVQMKGQVVQNRDKNLMKLAYSIFKDVSLRATLWDFFEMKFDISVVSIE